jgi:hypothetical protein
VLESKLEDQKEEEKKKVDSLNRIIDEHEKKCSLESHNQEGSIDNPLVKYAEKKFKQHMPFFVSADDRIDSQKKQIIEMGKIMQIKKKGKCETRGCDGTGNTNLVSKRHNKVENCPIRNKIQTLKKINTRLSTVNFVSTFLKLKQCNHKIILNLFRVSSTKKLLESLKKLIESLKKLQ